MKRFLNLILAVSFGLSSSAQAHDKFWTNDPKLVREFVKLGPGVDHNFQRSSDGGFVKLHITKITRDGDYVILDLEPTNNVVEIHFDDVNNFRVEAAPANSTVGDLSSNGSTGADPATLSEANDGAPSPGTPSATTDWSQGLVQAGISGLTAGLILATGYDAQIDEAYRRIDELRRQMGEDFNRLDRAEFDLRQQTAIIRLKATQTKPSEDILKYDFGKLSEARIRKSFDQSSTEISRLQFESSNSDFVVRERAVQSQLVKARVRDEVDQTLFDVSKQSLLTADRRSSLGLSEDAETYLDIAKRAADLLVGLDPITGFGRSLYESVSGRNLITGENLTTTERTLAVLGVVTSGYTLKAAGAFRAIESLSIRIAPKLKQSLTAAQDLFKAARGTLKPQTEKEIERSINMWSKMDERWGLTRKHLEKHFLGESQFSLKKIDPGGNLQKWFEHMEALFKRPISDKLLNGAVEIRGVFPRTNGSGDFKMGVRLWPNADGTFEFITVLTDQRKM